MEPGDEFEMKPLTPGLGFHKRQVSLKEHMVKTGLAQQNLRRPLPSEPPTEMIEGTQAPRSSKEIIAELHEALKPPTSQRANAAAQVKMTEVLPRDITEVRNPRSTPEITPVRDSLRNVDFQIPDKNLTESTGVRRGAHDGLVKPLTPVPVSLASILLDSAIVLAFSLIFLMTLVMVTGVDLVAVAQSSQSEFATQLSLMALYLAVYEMYAIVSRSFFGCTVGEWTFDLQLGDDKQIAKSYYPLLVLWRSVLILLTGLVLLPFLSLITRRDWAAKFSGLQLYRKNT